MRSSLMELIMYGTMKQFDPVVNEIVRPPAPPFLSLLCVLQLDVTQLLVL